MAKSTKSDHILFNVGKIVLDKSNRIVYITGMISNNADHAY